MAQFNYTSRHWNRRIKIAFKALTIISPQIFNVPESLKLVNCASGNVFYHEKAWIKLGVKYNGKEIILLCFFIGQGVRTKNEQ